MKFLFTIVLALFTAHLLTAQHIAVKSFRMLENDSDPQTKFPVEDQNGDVCALIKVMTTETGFDWDGGQLGIRKILQKTGEIWIYVPFGAKRITISHAVFGVLRGYDYPLEIKEAAVYEMVLTISKAPTAVLVVSSDPSGADVYIDGKPKGTTPFVSNEMRIGAYQLRLEKTGFETVSKRIELQEGKPTIIKETLRKKEEEKIKTAWLQVSSDPSGADVYIDGKPKGATPLPPNEMRIGAYLLRLEKTGFETVSKKIELQEGKPTIINETLRKKPEVLRADSINEERKRAEGDTLQSKREKKGFGIFDIPLGNTYALGKMSALKIHSPRLEFNTAEGVNIAYRMSYFKRWARGDALNETGRTRRLEISPDFRYAFARRKFTGFLKVEYKPRPGRVGSTDISLTDISLTGGRYIQQFNGNEPVLPLVNTLYTLVQGYNYMKIFERDFIELNFQITQTGKLTLRSSWSLAKRHELPDKIRYTYYKENKNRLTPNIPVNAGRASASFSEHLAFTGRLGLEARPWRSSNGFSPVFSLNYAKGFNRIFGSRVNYDLLELGVHFDTRQGLDFALRTGKFLNTKSMYFMDYKHFAGNLTAFVTTNPMGSFRLLDYYKYSTNDKYFSAHIHYNFRKFLFTHITKFHLLGMSESLFANHLAAPYLGNFTEAGYGLKFVAARAAGDSGKKRNSILRHFRLELAASFQNGSYAGYGVRIGVSSDLAAYFSDK